MSRQTAEAPAGSGEEVPPPPPPPPPPYHGTPAWMHGASVAAAVLGPVGLMLPPRRMGVRSLLLAGGAFFATSQLTYDYTGQSLYQRFQLRMSQMTGTDLPEAAVQRQAAMRAERERRRLAAAAAAAGAAGAAGDTQGPLHKLWMGNEKEDWTRERAQREKEVLDAGGGYWELIVEQIGDVWTDLRKKGGKNGGEVKLDDEPKR